MKRITFSVIFLSWCFILCLTAPVVAQSQFSYLPTSPPYYQPYYPPQSPLYPGGMACYSYILCYQPYQWGGPSYGPEELYQCGLSLVYAKRYNEAIQVFSDFLRYYPQSQLADNALYWTGECYYAQKQYTTALAYFQRVLFEYPKGNKVPDAMLKIALSHISVKNYREGCRGLHDLICRYPRSEPARRAYRWLNRCGWQSYPYPYGYGIPSYDDPTYPKNW